MHHHMPVLHMQEMQKMLASTQAGKRASKLSEEACAEGEQREEQLKQARLCSERHGTCFTTCGPLMRLQWVLSKWLCMSNHSIFMLNSHCKVVRCFTYLLGNHVHWFMRLAGC